MLTGSVTGSSRAEIQEKARVVAIAYYGTEHVDVDLRDESAETLAINHNGDVLRTTFAANFDAHPKDTQQ